jgi:serine protease Do
VWCRSLAWTAALLLSLFAAMPGRSAAADATATPFAQVFAQLAGRLEGCVVNISTTQAVSEAVPKGGITLPPAPGASLDQFFHDFLGERGGSGGLNGPAHIVSLGSGFIVDPAGFIVTNNHVIVGAERITVTLSDNTSHAARIVGRDSVSDLALLKIDTKKPLPAVKWGDSTKTKVGDWVLTIGNPFGLGGSVTAGIISAIARDIHAGPYDDFLQTDAAINRGNSGGPMFNLAGEVIGINTAIFSPSGGSVGIGFAVPSSFAQPIIEQMKTTGKVERGWIGARIQPVTEDLAEAVGLDKNRGAMIAAIDPDSPAAQAKLLPGDVILAYDGKPVGRSRQLPRLVADTPPDKSVALLIWRDGKPHSVTLRVALLNPDRPAVRLQEPKKPKPPAAVDVLGLKLAKLTPDLRKRFSLSEVARGAVITEVPQNSAAAAQGLQPGDLVVGIGRSPIASPEAAEAGAAAARKLGRKYLLMRVERDGSARFIALPAEGG